MTEPARSIGKLGFRKWYERRLIESHAWLITCFLCSLAIAASLEGVSFTRAESLPLLAFVFVGGLVCWHALNRYRAIMNEAERLGKRRLRLLQLLRRVQGSGGLSQDESALPQMRQRVAARRLTYIDV